MQGSQCISITLSSPLMEDLDRIWKCSTSGCSVAASAWAKRSCSSSADGRPPARIPDGRPGRRSGVLCGGMGRPRKRWNSLKLSVYGSSSNRLAFQKRHCMPAGTLLLTSEVAASHLCTSWCPHLYHELKDACMYNLHVHMSRGPEVGLVL